MSKLIELAETVKAARTEIETLQPAEASRFFARMAPLEKRLSRSTPKTIPEAAALAGFIVTWNEDDDPDLAQAAMKRLAAGLRRLAAAVACGTSLQVNAIMCLQLS